jgi:outer membrane immunogenic protein
MAVRPAAPVRAFSWTGCHAGGLVGWEWGRQDSFTTTSASRVISTLTPPGPFNGAAVSAGQPFFGQMDMNGFNGDGYAGCDYQFGSIVVGVEGDWSSVNKSGQSFATPNTITPGTLTGAGLIGGPAPFGEAQERWYATARARVGYAVDKWLFFVTGGAAWTKVDYSQFMLCGTAGSTSGSFTATCSTAATGYFALDSTKRSGWTVGAGVDYAPAALHGNFLLRVEYLYVDYGSFTTFNAPLVGAGGLYDGTSLSTRLNNHIVRFGLAYKFL